MPQTGSPPTLILRQHCSAPPAKTKMATQYSMTDYAKLLDDSLESLTFTNPSIAYDRDHKIIYRRPHHSHQVPIVSGGWDSAFADLVGDGLLSAAVSGPGCQPPTSAKIRIAIEDRVDTCRGVLVIAGNGLYEASAPAAFTTAVERTQAAGLQVQLVTVGDDVNVPRSLLGPSRRTGIEGMVLVHKIAGALAATGAPLDQIRKVAQLTADNLISSRGPAECSDPSEVSSSVSQVLAQMLDPNDQDRGFLRVNSNEPVVLVNSHGGVPPVFFRAITTEVIRQLRRRWSISPVRVLSGTYAASLALRPSGFSISILNVVNTDIGGPSMIQLLDAPCEAAGWSAFVRKETWEEKSTATREGVSHPAPADVQAGLVHVPSSNRSAATSHSGEADQEEEMEHALLGSSLDNRAQESEASSTNDDEYEIV